MRFYILIFVCSFLAFSCDETPGTSLTCDVVNPVVDLAWLADEILAMEESQLSEFLYVSQAKLGSMTVFIFENCCPFCFSVPLVYTCSGDPLESVDLEALSDDVVIWKPDDSTCNF